MSKKYQVFTPQETVNEILNDIGYIGPGIINKTIIDISCGDGAFLREALKRLLIECDKQSIPYNQAIDICVDNIYGYEIDQQFYRDCYKKMSDIVRHHINNNKKNVKWINLHNSDGLSIKDVEKFDFVVGNPPYISYKDMGEEKRKDLSENFETCKDWRFDYSYAFIEKSIKILKQDGVSAIISPINMYRIKSGSRLRAFLKPYLYKVIDVTEDGIFPGVLTNPVISFFNKANKNGFIQFGKKNNLKPISIENFYNKGEIELDSKKKRRFGDYYDVCNGVATLLNKAFIIPDDFSLEHELIYNAISPKQKRYGFIEKIIFPYIIKGNELLRIDEETLSKEYPNVYKHLLTHKYELERRKSSSNTAWFEYGRRQAITKINNKKIMMPIIISEKFRPFMAGEKDIVYAGFMITARSKKEHSLDDAFKILSDNKFYEYIKRVGVKMNGNSYRYSVNDIKNYLY